MTERLPSTKEGGLRKRGLEPIIDKNSRVLVLGTLPGDVSLRCVQYYANPKSQFWTILSAVYREVLAVDYSSKLLFLRKKRIALWDVLQRADREGSLDRDIANGEPNDFSRLLGQYPSVKAIAFNGTKARRLFLLHVESRLGSEMLETLRLVSLPSTSATPGRHVLPLDEKIEKWKVIASLYFPVGSGLFTFRHVLHRATPSGICSLVYSRRVT
jgi:hypoxanthine-DNA glycosylase